ncbi:hypothetical protein [Streptomyces sp. NPDC017991]|uniref:hypothetical protein n=1 Tax=Streptomyces sp. NPDC017991 TaxID=3365026 RepID=UPI0037BB8ACF
MLHGLTADRAWDVLAIGGSILDQWPDIAPADLLREVGPGSGPRVPMPANS